MLLFRLQNSAFRAIKAFDNQYVIAGADAECIEAASAAVARLLVDDCQWIDSAPPAVNSDARKSKVFPSQIGRDFVLLCRVSMLINVMNLRV